MYLRAWFARPQRAGHALEAAEHLLQGSQHRGPRRHLWRQLCI